MCDCVRCEVLDEVLQLIFDGGTGRSMTGRSIRIHVGTSDTRLYKYLGAILGSSKMRMLIDYKGETGYWTVERIVSLVEQMLAVTSALRSKGAHKFLTAPLKKIDLATLEPFYSKEFCSIHYFICQEHKFLYSKGSIRGCPACEKGKTMENNIGNFLPVRLSHDGTDHEVDVECLQN